MIRNIKIHNDLTIIEIQKSMEPNKCTVATLALGSRPRLRGLQGCGPRGSPGVKAKGSPGVTSHTPGSARKCEGV